MNQQAIQPRADDLFGIIGVKEWELFLLRQQLVQALQRIAELEAAVGAPLAAPQEKPE